MVCLRNISADTLHKGDTEDDYDDDDNNDNDNVKVQNIFQGEIAQTVKREQLQHYIYSRNMFCFRYILL